MIEQKIRELIDREYTFYAKDVVPYIDSVEVFFAAIPDGMLNEIRKFTGHISSASIEKTDKPETRIENINAAHKHLRRILLDCYKLMCIHQQLYIKAFQKKYRFCNTSSVHDGNFDVFLHNKLRKAENTFKAAKDMDNTGKNDKELKKYSLDTDTSQIVELSDELDEVYEKYCQAYNDFCEVVDYIDEHYEGVVRAARNDKISKGISFLGWLISIVLAVVLYCLDK